MTEFFNFFRHKSLIIPQNTLFLNLHSHYRSVIVRKSQIKCLRKCSAIVSIIIPVYNVEKYIRQCLDSVISQTYHDLEIILVDDGSTDSSGSICDDYACIDERIKVYHTANHGLSAARNYGIDCAQGEYIAFLDSDDWFTRNAIQTFLTTAQETRADIVACRYYDEYVDKTAESSGLLESCIVEGDAVLAFLVLEPRISVAVWNKFYRVSLFETIRFPEGRIFEDMATTWRVFSQCEKLVNIPDCLIHYRRRENSLSNIHSLQSLTDYWLAYKERFDALSPLSAAYYQRTLTDCITAISRTWRWFAGCSPAEKKQAESSLDEMQQFASAHKSEILHNPSYSRYTQLFCILAGIRTQLFFRALYAGNSLYRTFYRKEYYKE